MARTGRRPGQTETREAILAAARKLFAEQGFDGATVRAIASEAGVNPALIHHFFGSKEQVFTASLALPVDPAVMKATIIDGPREQAGERLVRFYVTLLGDEQARQPFLALLRSVTSNPDAARMLRQFLHRAIIQPIGSALGVDEVRMAAIGAQLVGIVVVRHIVQVEPLAEADTEEVIKIVAPIVQAYLDG